MPDILGFLEGIDIKTLSTASIIASIPAIIWLITLLKKTNLNKKTLALIFALGCLTAPALLLLQVFWEQHPEFNIAALIEQNIKTQSQMFIAMFILFGALEEIIKLYVISYVDKKTTYIKTVNDTIKYSIIAALGFAFTENIYYLYNFLNHIDFRQIAKIFMFRSLFTTVAHMIFSGIFGYYYAMGKFSIDLSKQERITGQKSKTTELISKLFNLPISQAFREKMILKGLFIAIAMHATFNYILQYGHTLPVVIFVILGAIYMWFLMKRKAGNLLINNDISEKRSSTISKSNEAVIIELISLWFNEKRYVDVIHVCHRLLERDPDNNLVKLFKAKALDKMEENDPYKKILKNILKSKDDLSIEERNKFSKYLQEKEIYLKVKDLIKKQVEKEGKKYVDYSEKIKTDVKETKKNKNSKHLIKELSQGDVFKID